jgi:hypothetical protein
VANDFATSPAPEFNLVGAASFLGGAVRLTPAAPDLDGTLASVAVSPNGTAAYQLDFDFRTSGGGGHVIWLYIADAAKAPATEIAPQLDAARLSLELDFFQNSWDPDDHHVDIGYFPVSQPTWQGTHSLGFSMSDGNWHHLRLRVENGLADVTVWSASGQPEKAFTAFPLQGYVPNSWRLMLRGNTGSCSPCFENWVDNIVWTSIDPDVPTVCGATATSAQVPASVEVTGYKLSNATAVKVDGATVPFVAQSDNLLSLTVGPSEPGFHDLRVEFPTTAVDVVGGLALWPTLAASTTGIGGTASVAVRNGTFGIAVVAYATGVLPPPGIAIPPTWSTLKLDITGPYVIASSYGLPASGELDVAYPVPNDPSLAGSTVHVQAWCQQGFFGPGVTYSFTNAAAVTL